MSRRKALAAGSGLTLAATAGCVGKVKDVTGLGKSELEKEFETIRKQINKYDGSPKKAFDDGYTQILGPYINGMGWHIANPKYIGDAVKNGFDIKKPQIIYFNNDGKIGGVEFGAPAAKISKSPDLFSDENVSDATEKWTVHKQATHIMANGNGEQDDPKSFSVDELLTKDWWTEFRPPNPDLKPGDKFEADYGRNGTKEERVLDLAFTHPSLAALHVWTHEENPEGPFNPVNPNFAQD